VRDISCRGHIEENFLFQKRGKVLHLASLNCALDFLTEGGETGVGNRNEGVSRSGIADTAAETIIHALYINVGFAREVPDSKDNARSPFAYRLRETINDASAET
jgi:hypothetical protein